MLRKIRLTLAVCFFLCITGLFLDFTWNTSYLAGVDGEKSSVLAGRAGTERGIVIALVVLTLVFGRVYCSVICPLGVMQDLFAWFGKRGKKRSIIIPILRKERMALRLSGSVPVDAGGRYRFRSSFTGSLQLFRTDCFQFAGSFIRMGKQPAGLLGRTGRQLCLL